MKQYVYHYHRTLDDGRRLQLPSELEFKAGDAIYAEPKKGEVLCYDSEKFEDMSKSFLPERFSAFKKAVVDNQGRVYVNNMGGLIKEVEVEGRGDHFAIVRAEGFLEVAYHHILKLLGEKG